MSEIVPKIKKLSSLGIPLLAKRVLDKHRTKSNDKQRRKRDLSNSTWTYKNSPLVKSSFFDLKGIEIGEDQSKILNFHLNMYLAHRFDILGSFWISANFNVDAHGFLRNKVAEVTNQATCNGGFLESYLLPQQVSQAQNIYKLIHQVNADYQSIDWQKEIKSGFHYDVKKWYKDNLSLGRNCTGTDLKVARELSRFHHLPQLAIISQVLTKSSQLAADEFVCQTLDFIACNPPRMGVHWLTTMDVAIRAINMLVGYDLIADKINNDCFHQIFADSIFEHGKHIFENLEDKSGLTNNHYLANIVGLLVICSYLPTTSETKVWLHFSYKSFIKEYKKQFLSDGGNFEASTTYHALGMEMVLVAVFCLYQLDHDQLKTIDRSHDNLLPDWMIHRIHEGISLLEELIKTNGNIVQFGDNDSGRILRLFPTGKFMSKEELLATYISLSGYERYLPDADEMWDENYLDYNAIISMARGLLGETKWKKPKDDSNVENSLFKKDAIQKNFRSYLPDRKDHSNLILNTEPDALEYQKKFIVDFPSSVQSEKLYYRYYESVGYLIVRSDHFHLAIKIGNQDNYVHSLGHCHNDVLSFELTVDNKELVIDPGTFVYTSSRKLRDEFRSNRTHSTIRVNEEEQNRWYDGIFWNFNMFNEVKSKLIAIKNHKIITRAEYRNIVHIRIFKITSSQLIITDNCNKDFEQNWNTGQIKTAGYGKLMNYPNALTS